MTKPRKDLGGPATPALRRATLRAVAGVLGAVDSAIRELEARAVASNKHTAQTGPSKENKVRPQRLHRRRDR
jgi:hypothetical protein